MGKTKIKTIDDSVKATEEKKIKKAPKKEQDELVEKLKQELGIEKTEKPTQPKTVVKTAVKTDVKTKPKKQEKVESSQQRSKKYLEKVKDLDRNKFYLLPEALELVKKLSYSKFDGTLEAHVNTIQTGLHGLVAESFQQGKTEYKTEAKTPIIHIALGKLSQPNAELEANVKTLLQTIGKTRIKKVSLSPTMGPGIKLDLSSI